MYTFNLQLTDPPVEYGNTKGFTLFVTMLNSFI